MTAPELSVIVITHERRDLLRACLESLARQTADLGAYEVVVVVDGSTDGTSEMLAEIAPPFRLSVVIQAQAGPSAARNAGAGRAAGRVLLFIDDDEEAAPTHVSAHLAAHRGRDAICAIGTIHGRLAAGADRLVALRAEASRRHYEQLGTRAVTYADCCGGNCSVARSTFDEVGGFASDLPRENDFDFAYRLHELGVEFVFAPGAVVTQFLTKDWRQTIADAEIRGRLAITLYRRHPALLSTMPFGGHGGDWSRGWLVLRALALAGHLPPVALVRIGFLLPRTSWARAWFRFVWSYCYWRGVRAAGDRELWRRSRRGTLILLYHAFGAPHERPSRYVVPARRFARQMAWLKRCGYHVISLDEYTRCRVEHRLPPANSVVITIDDGYVDTDTLARPILERLGFTATVFLLTVPEGRQDGGTEATLAGRPILDHARARSILGGAIEFGAHSRTHPDLTSLAPGAAAEEVRGSKDDLERSLRVPVTAFAYPYGESSPQVRDVVRAAGFRTACGVTPGHNRPSTDAFDLRRISVAGTYTLLRFAATLLIGDTRGLVARVWRR